LINFFGAFCSDDVEAQADSAAEPPVIAFFFENKRKTASRPHDSWRLLMARQNSGRK
jgi:hypothetical protein